MQVYRLKNDVNRYQYFLPAKTGEELVLVMDCTSRFATWNPPEVFIYEPLSIRGDFFQFLSGTLITSPLATETLRGFLEMAGELLPIYHDNEVYSLLNVTTCINCLNQEQTEWRYDSTRTMRTTPKKYVFHPDRFAESRIFKIPETYRGELFVVEYEAGEDDEFRTLVEQHHLRGLLFEKVWSSDEVLPAQ